MSERCKIQVLGKDPNDSKKPARFSDDPKVKRQQKMDLAACRKGKREDLLKKGKDKVNELFNKKKDSIDG
tara:strand:- start:245 stop:454 length:210 start_codon:yes stop_codon:yes gene_type:complete